MDLHFLIERAAPVHQYDYANWHTDERPRVLYLGKWRHPNTKNMLVGGINLNKLNASQTNKVRAVLPDIYGGGGSLKDHFDRMNAALPWVVPSRLYQTWDKKYVSNLTKDLLNWVTPDDLDQIDPTPPSAPPPDTDRQATDDDLRDRAGATDGPEDATARAKDAKALGHPKPEPIDTRPQAPLEPTEEPPTDTDADGLPDEEPTPLEEPGDLEVPGQEEPEGEPPMEEPPADFATRFRSAWDSMQGQETPTAPVPEPEAPPAVPEIGALDLSQADRDRARADQRRMTTTSGGATITQPSANQRRRRTGGGWASKFLNWAKRAAGGASSKLATLFRDDVEFWGRVATLIETDDQAGAERLTLMIEERRNA